MRISPHLLRTYHCIHTYSTYMQTCGDTVPVAPRTSTIPPSSADEAPTPSRSVHKY
ncbi:hypothetical protein HETIRDRAFT_166722 [Heterobasidion irregulare TC 32-1]|uniref:Uncharacterized protein n=1 Tax=Heterobasidion irregulare (strain TC 32-1) TaxID=747525 RepID=W4KP74_HETIT|nr:uncharacterized protein HETIRDRAFT_166722 [Heterobasidion irregulare TC 32-1]ETW87190.1 hypothetical protein HETIRDRAFT_166722 [Heterobasidion irregulare TC 32-1]